MQIHSKLQPSDRLALHGACAAHHYRYGARKICDLPLFPLSRHFHGRLHSGHDFAAVATAAMELAMNAAQCKGKVFVVSGNGLEAAP
jgi:hypothetical protein